RPRWPRVAAHEPALLKRRTPQPLPTRAPFEAATLERKDTQWQLHEQAPPGRSRRRKVFASALRDTSRRDRSARRTTTRCAESLLAGVARPTSSVRTVKASGSALCLPSSSQRSPSEWRQRSLRRQAGKRSSASVGD